MFCSITAMAIAFAVTARHHRTPTTLVITVNHDVLPADGNAQAQIHAERSDGTELRTVAWQFRKGESLVRVEKSSSNLELVRVPHLEMSFWLPLPRFCRDTS